MNRSEFWKNFKLGSELDIAGRFVYNGLKAFDEMNSFYYEEDAFEFLYNISVGIERLLKIWIILTEHDQVVDQEQFESSLITHNHNDLVSRIAKNKNFNIGKAHNKFINLLTKFYKSHRYDRFALKSTLMDDKEKLALIQFIESELNINIDIETNFGITKNSSRIKKFIGKIIGKICEECYTGISKEARRLNIHTYEILTYSKAYKIFTCKKYDFEDEKILSRELIVYLLKQKKKGANSKLLSELEALDFDPALEADYFLGLESDLKKLEIMDELECFYEDDMDEIGDRLGHLEAGVSQLYDNYY